MEDIQFIERLRNGDQAAFMMLLDSYQTSLVRVAMIYVHEQEIAEEVVQETWVGVLRVLARFEGRSSLKTWVFSIAVNLARTRAQREGRYVPLSTDEEHSDEPSVSADRFHPADHPWNARHWAIPPQDWQEVPEERLLSQEVQEVIRRAIEDLPAQQRAVITFRDVQNWSTEEVCNVLSVTETNQRVLLHRARSVVRRKLEEYLEK
jgi:RNA polymerase sigma-70 factor (ECF subfamily)